MESYAHMSGLEDQVVNLEDQVKALEEKLSAVYSELNNKDNLVKQHAKEECTNKHRPRPQKHDLLATLS